MATSNSSRYLFAVSTFDSEPDRAAVPLVLANNALASGGDVLIWLTLTGVKLGKQGEAAKAPAKSFPSADELLATFREAGGRLALCPPCAKTHGVTDENVVQGAEWMGGAAFVGEMATRQVVSF
jgi:predicted peroxiredoxin